MASIELSLACHPTDRTRAVMEGEQSPRGIDLQPVPMSTEAASRGMLEHRDFDVAAVSVSGFLAAVDGDDVPVVGIPVFPSRAFVHGTVFVAGPADIASPADLAGCRVGIESSWSALGLWVRGILADRHDVAPDDVHWVQADGSRSAGSPSDEVGLTTTDRPLGSALADGTLDALVADSPPAGSVDRLFPDVRATERAYYRESGCFPILSVVVLHRDRYDDHPWVARELSEAFESAKAESLAALDDGLEYPCAVPWLRPEVEATRALMGADYWPYGIDANRESLETAIRYAADLGITTRRQSLEDLFARETFTAFTV